MVRTHYIALLLALVALSACRKDYIAPSAEEVALFVRGDLDGIPLDLSAGLSDVVQLTSTERNDAGLTEFQATFDDVDGSGGSFQIVLMDNERHFPGEEVDIAEVLQPGSFQWALEPPTTDPMRLQFYPSQPNSENYSWVINGETFDNVKHPDFSFDQIGPLEATLVTSSGDCSDELTRTLAIFNDDMNYFFYETFSVEQLDDQTLRFTIDNYDPSVHGEINWTIDFEDQTLQELNGPSIDFALAANELFTVKMQVINSTNNYESNYSKRVSINDEALACNASFEFEQFPTNLNQLLGRALVRYTTNEGVIFESYHKDGAEQSGSFDVSLVEDFFNPSENSNTLLATFSAQCTLYDVNDITNTKELNVQKGSAAFPIVTP